MPEDSLCQAGAGMRNTEPTPGCRVGVWSQHCPKGSRDNQALRTAPLSDGHSRKGHNRLGKPRGLRL